MKTGCLVTKVLAALVGLAVLCVGLIFGARIIRTSMPYVLRSDLEQLAASAPYNNAQLATEICGTPVDFLGSAETTSPVLALPRARLLSWKVLYPLEGRATARITGIGTRRPDWRVPNSDYKAVTEVCEATITFKYRCAWSWNGVATVLEKQFIEAPTVVRPTKR